MRIVSVFIFTEMNNFGEYIKIHVFVITLVHFKERGENGFQYIFASIYH